MSRVCDLPGCMRQIWPHDYQATVKRPSGDRIFCSDSHVREYLDQDGKLINAADRFGIRRPPRRKDRWARM